MLAISIRMPTSTGGPAEGGGGEGGEARGGVSRRVAPGGPGRGSGERGRLTSEVGPEADVVALEQPVHRLLHVGHVAGPVGAAGRSRGGLGRRPGGAAPASLRGPAGAHLRAAHATASTSGSDRARGPSRLAPAAAPLIPAPAAPPPRGGRAADCNLVRSGATIPDSTTHARSGAPRPPGRTSARRGPARGAPAPP